MADISILILACNGAGYTRRCLDSLSECLTGSVRVILADNGSQDETPEVLDAFEETVSGSGVEVRRLRFDHNLGAVAGRNVAMKEVEGEYVVFLDNDVIARSTGWLAALRGYLDSHAEAGIVGPKLLFPIEPFRIQCAGCEVGVSGRVSFRGRGEARDEERFNAETEVQALISACWMMRRRLWKELGELDELFSPVQFEDIDYCYRAREAGRKVVYVPAVEMYHFENVTTSTAPKMNYARLTGVNALRFKRKWRETIRREGGKQDRELPWRSDIPSAYLEEIGDLPVV